MLLRFFCVLSLLMVSCVNDRANNLDPLRWLQKQPCEAPCWEGIIVGTTSVRDSIKILEKNQLVSKVYFKEGFGPVNWQWQDQVKLLGDLPNLNALSSIGFGGDLNETVKTMHLIYPSGFSIADVIKAYGEPSHLYVVDLRSKTDESEGVIGFIYLSQGFRITVGIRKGDGLKVIDTMTILDDVSTFWPNSIDGLTKMGYVGDNIIPWPGWDSFSRYCDLVNKPGCEL
jgi:hypothetical protein